jgi:hypothetical protein
MNDGWTVYQKFTCENCGQRLTIHEPNVFYAAGTCDKCNHVTDIAKNGCNYLLSSTPVEKFKPTDRVLVLNSKDPDAV